MSVMTFCMLSVSAFVYIEITHPWEQNGWMLHQLENTVLFMINSEKIQRKVLGQKLFFFLALLASIKFLICIKVPFSRTHTGRKSVRKIPKQDYAVFQCGELDHFWKDKDCTIAVLTENVEFSRSVLLVNIGFNPDEQFTSNFRRFKEMKNNTKQVTDGFAGLNFKKIYLENISVAFPLILTHNSNTWFHFPLSVLSSLNYVFSKNPPLWPPGW